MNKEKNGDTVSPSKIKEKLLTQYDFVFFVGFALKQSWYDTKINYESTIKQGLIPINTVAITI